MNDISSIAPLAVRQQFMTEPGLGAGNFLDYAVAMNPNRDVPMVFSHNTDHRGEVVLTGHSLTELAALRDRYAKWYHANGVRPGEPVGIVVAYLACYTAHGASNPMHTTLLHRQVAGSYRTTVLSMNSMVSQPAGAIGAIVLSALADGTSLTTTMIVAGVLCAVAAPLYLPALWAERRRASAGPGGSTRPAVAGTEVSDSPV